MLFRVELRTDDPELIETLNGLRNKAKFVKRAIKHYISTRQGRETLRVMSKQDSEDTGKVKKRDQKPEKPVHEIKPEKPVHDIPGNRKGSAYDLDRFL